MHLIRVPYSQKKTSRALNNKKSNGVTQFSQISNEQLKSAVAWRRTAMATQWRQMADCSKRELQWLRRCGHRRWHDALVECSALASKRNKVAVASPCLPHGAVLVQGMAEPYHASNGRQAQRAWIWSAVGCVTNEGPGAAVWCGRSRTFVLNKRAVQQHSSQTAVCRVDCLPCWPTSHCRNPGMSVPRTPSAIAESAVRLIDECCVNKRLLQYWVMGIICHHLQLVVWSLVKTECKLECGQCQTWWPPCRI